jgi:hypothetical protein
MRRALGYPLAVAHSQGRLPPSLLLTQSGPVVSSLYDDGESWDGLAVARVRSGA